jgi:1-pyrroline-5-carboxylate dehydrogenase
MSNAYFKVPSPINEPIRAYGPGSPEKIELKQKLTDLKSREIDIPLIIGGEEVRTGDTAEMRIPHDHGHLLGVYHRASEKESRTWPSRPRSRRRRPGRSCHGNSEPPSF